jgi:ketosteroid isomerase-like protein
MTENTNRETARRWVDAYRRAWESNEPDDIRALFSEDAEYFSVPWEEPWRGHEGIVDGWLEARDEPGDTTFEWDIVAVDGATAVVRAVTDYTAERTYHNVWVIRFDENGRATEFTEWYMRV